MPIPTPHPDESHREFMARCMSDEVMQDEYPEDERAAICHGQWRDRERDYDMDQNMKLIQAIQTRSGQQFGYGITTADKYVLPALDEIGRGAAAKYFKCLGGVREQLSKRAAGTLVFCGEDTETIEKRTGSISDIEAIIGGKAPMHSMMAIINRLTTPSEDRDGDTLQTAGAMMDMKAPLLWQHIHTAPIGKMVRIIEQSKELLKVATVLLDLNDLTSDAAKLVEAGVLRFSHGFIPLEFEERKGGPMARFNILKFEIVEESLVSVPSNRDAEIELFSRGKLTSEPFKNHAKALFDARNPIVQGAEIDKEAFLRKEVGAIENKDKPAKGLPKCEKCGRVAKLEGTKMCADCRNRKLSPHVQKMFDIATQRIEPSSMECDWAARFIGCSVKDLHVHTTAAGGLYEGALLEGFEQYSGGDKCLDQRNLCNETEKPPVFEAVDLNSKWRKTFLIEGIRFYASHDGHKYVVRTWKGYGGQSFVVYADSAEKAQEPIDEAWKFVNDLNPLKGEAFALTGGFIPKDGTCWEDVFLSPEIEKSLKRTVRIVNDKGIDAANRGLLMSGPPGTGKTLSARVMLNETNATFIWVSPKDFYRGGGFCEAFQLARALAPSVLMFEDIDNWMSDYTIDLFKTEMDGLQKSSGVVTILTTNFPDRLPSALIDRPGRFHDVLEIHLPDRAVRLRMLQKWAMFGQESGASLDALDKMADETDGYSGAHLYELCHFAKIVRDEDECSLDDALTKAFAKVKEQRELINHNQLSGSSYRPGRRELEVAAAKGLTGSHKAGFNDDQRTAFLEGKEMGECKGCGEKRNLDEDGYCAKCAKEEAEDGEGGGSEAPPMPSEPKRTPAGQQTKAGRVLSQRNYDALVDVMEDLGECESMEMGRPAKALVRGCRQKIKAVIDAATPTDPETMLPEKTEEPKSIDHVLRQAIEAAMDNRQLRDRIRKAIDSLDRGEELEELADMYRVVTSTG